MMFPLTVLTHLFAPIEENGLPEIATSFLLNISGPQRKHGFLFITSFLSTLVDLSAILADGCCIPVYYKFFAEVRKRKVGNKTKQNNPVENAATIVHSSHDVCR
nr:TPA_asm: hypothetical protein [Rhodactis coral adintovirus]